MEFMSTLPPVTYNLAVRENASTGLTQGQILDSLGPAWREYLIRSRRERFNNRYARFDVMKSDPIAHFIGQRWIAEITSKPMRSYEKDEMGEETEIMMDFWERWDQLNMNEPLRAVYEPFGFDGYCVGYLFPTVIGGVGYKKFGFFECPPEFWKRYNIRGTEFHNVIYEYRVFYVPIPAGFEYLGNYNIHAEEEFIYPQQPGFFHFTRDQWNHGIGMSRMQPIWASTTKLRKIAHADFRRSLVFNMFEFPEDMDEDIVKPMIEAARHADEDNGVAIPKRINPNTQEVEDWPKFYDRTWDTEGGKPRADPSSGGTLLRSAEYARVLIALGYTETKLVGSQPGEVTGSKLDLTRDDEVDIREFNLIKPIIKWFAAWLLQNGFLEGLEADTLERVETGLFDIKSHTEWEIIENRAAEMAAAEMAEDQAEASATENYDVRHNTLVHNMVIRALRNNVDLPITPISSTWLSHVAVDRNTLYAKVPGWKKGPWMPFRFKNDEIAGLMGRDMLSSGSRGAWIWDNIWAESVRGDIGKGIFKGERNLRPGVSGGDSAEFPFMDRPFEEGLEVSGFETFEQRAEALLNPPSGFIGTGGTRRPLLDVSSPASQLTEQPASQTAGQAPSFFSYGAPNITGQVPTQTTTQAQFTPGRVFAPGSITGSKKTGPGPKRKRGVKAKGAGTTPIVPFNLTSPTTHTNSVSFSRANTLMLEARGTGMSKSTWPKMKKFIELLEENNNFRINSIDIGNPMSFDVPLHYIQDGKRVQEFACKREWKKLNSHKGILYMYENLEHGGTREVVGTYNYSWDKKSDMPTIQRDYDENKIRSLHEEWGYDTSPILDKLNIGVPLSMSTEYFCSTMKHNGKTFQVNMHNGKGQSILKGIAIVKHGNCDAPFCSFKGTEV
jgi:hypothetical protein